MPHVYILRCADNSYYVSSTTSLSHRLAQHAAGEGARYTARRLPVELAWAAETESIADAYALEKQIQGWGRAKREALMSGDLTELPALSSRARRLRDAPEAAAVEERTE